MNDAPTEILPAAAAAPEPAAAARTAGSCRTCAAPLAADQRYCLSCGERVATPRVDWAQLAPVAGGATPPPAPTRGARWTLMLDRVGGPMGAAAVVLVALGVGVLLGQGGGGSQGPATIIQRPPIVNVQGGGTAAPSDTSGGADTSGGRGGKHGGGRGSSSTRGIPQALTNDGSGGDLDRLRAQPDEQATGGTAPRTDHKQSGGGGATETIG